MTEAEWLSSGDPSNLLSFLHDERKGDARRERLFAVACCNRVGHLILDPRSRNALTVAEQFADGLASEAERAAAHAAAQEAAAAIAAPSPPTGAVPNLPAEQAIEAAYAEAAHAAVLAAAEPVSAGLAAHHAAGAFTLFDNPGQGEADVLAALQGERTHQADLLRDLFGNPFRPVNPESECHTVPVGALAKQIYSEQAFERLPALADALADAGCTDAELLDHLRFAGPHEKGCWALDLVLGKS